MSRLSWSARRAALFLFSLCIASALGTSKLQAFGELWFAERERAGWALEIGPYANIIDFSPTISGSTNRGTHDRYTADETLTAIGVDASLLLPLSSITGFKAPGTQIILGVRAGGFTGGSEWTAHLDLDEAIPDADTTVTGEFNGYGRILGGVRQTVWEGQSGQRVAIEVKGGAGIVDQEIRGTTKVADNNQQFFFNQQFFNQQFGNDAQFEEVRFKDSGTRGFGFGELGFNYTGRLTAGINFSTSLGVGLFGVEDSSFRVRTPNGDTRISLDNDTEAYGYWSIALRYASDVRLKRDVRHIATRDDGLRLYTFKYLWDDQVYVGVMAQDLLRDAKWQRAVSAMANGYYAVDYRMLGLRMTALNL